MRGRRAFLGSMALAGAAAVVVGATTSSTPASAASTTVPAQAEGDSYAVEGQAFLLGTALGPTPIQIGPIVPAMATVPPGTDSQDDHSVAQFDSAGAQPLLDYLNVVRSTAKATLGHQAQTDCAIPERATTSGFISGPLTGGNGCVSIAQAGLINDGTQDNLVAAAVEAQSITQSCTATPQGFVNIARLALGGTDIIGGSSPLLGTNSPAPNTQIDIPGIATVILNEQHYDNQGHGLIVNAIHVFTAPDGIGALAQVDVVIGHAHSEAFCATGTTNTGGGGGNPGGSTSPVPVVTKLDSTKHANPGETVTYTITVDTKGCLVTRVSDFLPPGFIYVNKSASGDLGDAFVHASQQASGSTQIDFFNPAGFNSASGKLTETIKATIPTNAADGMYINNVNGTSAPVTGNTGCGEFQGSDTLPVTSAPPGAPPGTTGNNPGIIVPRPGSGATATATAQAATASPTASTQAATTLPNTASAGTIASGSGGVAAVLGGGLLVMSGLTAVGRRRRRRG